MRFLANLLPNFGIGGFVIAAIAGFKALSKALDGSSKQAKKTAQDFGPTSSIRAAFKAIGDQARDNAKSIDRMTDALNSAGVTLGQLTGRQLVFIKAEQRERDRLLKQMDQLTERAEKRARQERRTGEVIFSDIERQRKSLQDRIEFAQENIRLTLAQAKASREAQRAESDSRTARTAGPSAKVNPFFAERMDAARRMADLLPKIQQQAIEKQIEQQRLALERERQLEQERMRLYADGVNARIAATQRERAAQVKAQKAMANAVTASAQSYAAAALSAALYGGSISEAINATARAAFVEGTVGALGALAKAAVFSIINPPGVAPMLAAAKLYGAQAAVAGGIAAGTGGLAGGGGGGGSTAITEPTPADFGEPERREREDSTIFANFASGQGGSRPLSRGDARAIIGALVDIARDGGMRGAFANA